MLLDILFLWYNVALTYFVKQVIFWKRCFPDELQDLKIHRRQEIAQKIKEAREQGDLSENAEYDAAKDAQGLLEAKIAQLQDIISNCRIIDESQIDTSKVQILNKVTIKNIKTKATMTYTLVSESEADFKAGKLSITTPIAKALIGKKLGDKVEVQVPAGLMEFEIMDISI